MDQGGAITAADLRATKVSSGYDGVSRGANVWFNNTSGEYGLVIKGINTASCISLTLNFSVRKDNAAGTSFKNLILEYTNNSGTAWYSLPFTPHQRQLEQVVPHQWHHLASRSICKQPLS
jgi:hypothetical protein